MKVKFTLDAREFTQAMKEYAAVSKKDEKDIVLDRAGKVANSGFKNVKSLFGEFKRITPTESLLKSLPKRLGFRLKRKRNVSVASEIKRRIKARMTAASGWLPAVQRLTKRGVVLKKKKGAGSVVINLKEPSVTMINNMIQAQHAENKYHLMQGVLDSHVEDMRKYIEKKMIQRANQFSAK